MLGSGWPKVVALRWLAVTAAVWCVMVASASAVTADGDPASDILLTTSVYYPYQPTVAPSLQETLARALTLLARRGPRLKVAIIATTFDLGAVPGLFGKPQAYATFLEQEIAFEGRQPLLVVMPSGVGVSDAVSPAALRGVTVDSRHGVNGLTRSAIFAVLAVARRAGRPIVVGSIPSVTGATGGTPWLAIGVGVAVGVVLLSGLGVWRRRVRGGGVSA